MYLGRDETIPGAFYTQVTSPTDYDNAVDSIINRLHEIYTWDIVNPTLWKLIGLTGSPVKKFLTHYIQLSRRWNDYYSSSSANTWVNYFVKNWGYDPELVRVYLDALEHGYNNQTISGDIYQAYKYTAENTAGLPSIKSDIKDIVKYGIITVAVAGTVYFFGKDLLKKLV